MDLAQAEEYDHSIIGEQFITLYSYILRDFTFNGSFYFLVFKFANRSIVTHFIHFAKKVITERC